MANSPKEGITGKWYSQWQLGAVSQVHAGHRYSTDVDHVSALLRDQFDVVNGSLEHWEGWTTNRVNRPVVILGERHGLGTSSMSLP